MIHLVAAHLPATHAVQMSGCLKGQGHFLSRESDGFVTDSFAANLQGLTRACLTGRTRLAAELRTEALTDTQQREVHPIPQSDSTASHRASGHTVERQMGRGRLLPVIISSLEVGGH